MTRDADDRRFLDAAIALARGNVERGGRPFGAVVVKDGAVIATGVNTILASNDPTAHAEMSAIRAASHALASPDLSVYASGHPCPMCLAAMRMAGVNGVAFAYSNEDAAPFGLSTAAIYDELRLPFAEQKISIRHVGAADAAAPAIYTEWRDAGRG